MAEEETQAATEEATHDGAETEQQADTNKATEEQRAFTAEELQSEVDRRVAQAMKTAEERRQAELEKQQREQEKINALKEGEFEKAFKMTQAKLDQLEAELQSKEYKNDAHATLVKLGMSHYSDVLIPGTSTIDELIQRAEAFKRGMQEAAEQEVRKKLDTGPSRAPENVTPPPVKALSEMSKEEFIEWKRENKLV